MVFGSHLYGLDTPTSDRDYAGIYIPTLTDMMLGRVQDEISISTGNQHSKNTSEDKDIKTVSLNRFIKLACEGQTEELDMLHVTSQHIISGSMVWNDIQANRHRFYTKDMTSLVGYLKKQAAKYGVKGSRLAAMQIVIKFLQRNINLHKELYGQNVKPRLGDVPIELWPKGDYIDTIIERHMGGKRSLVVCEKEYESACKLEYILERIEKMYEGYGDRARQAERNEGVDWKAVSHAFRAAYQAKEIYENGTVTYPLIKRDLILKIKQGELEYKTEVAPALDSLIDEVRLLSDRSSYPESVDKDWWDEWLLRLYSRMFELDAATMIPSIQSTEYR